MAWEAKAKIIVNLGDEHREIVSEVVTDEESFLDADDAVGWVLFHRLYRFKEMVEHSLEKRGVADKYELEVCEGLERGGRGYHRSWMLAATYSEDESMHIWAYTSYTLE